MREIVGLERVDTFKFKSDLSLAWFGLEERERESSVSSTFRCKWVDESIKNCLGHIFSSSGENAAVLVTERIDDRRTLLRTASIFECTTSRRTANACASMNYIVFTNNEKLMN